MDELQSVAGPKDDLLHGAPTTQRAQLLSGFGWALLIDQDFEVGFWSAR